MVLALPIGLGTAILLAEFTRDENLFSRLIRRSLDVLAGVPSIIFGLFGNAFFSVTRIGSPAGLCRLDGCLLSWRFLSLAGE